MEFSNDKIKQIGFSQRMILLWILALILIYLFSFLFPPLIYFSYVGPFIVVHSIWGMGRAFGYGTFSLIVCCILLFIPLVGLLTLLSMNCKASRILKDAGMHVGLLGGSKEELEKLN